MTSIKVASLGLSAGKESCVGGVSGTAAQDAPCFIFQLELRCRGGGIIPQLLAGSLLHVELLLILFHLPAVFILAFPPMLTLNPVSFAHVLEI